MAVWPHHECERHQKSPFCKALCSQRVTRAPRLAKPLNRVSSPASTWKNCKVAPLFYWLGKSQKRQRFSGQKKLMKFQLFFLDSLLRRESVTIIFEQNSPEPRNARELTFC